MKIVPTRRTDYGIRALLFLAQSDGRRSKAAEIGLAMGVPKGFLHQVLQELEASRLVASRAGRNGGYALARPARDITIRDIVESLEGPIGSHECALRGGPCRWDSVCALHWVWSSAQQALAERLGVATLASVAAADRALADGTSDVPSDSHRLAKSWQEDTHFQPGEQVAST